jgi:outer membrane protein OmpA-like peptidoglycan-associated protein
LSQGRANAVKQALVERGIDASRTEAKGYGPDRPVATNATPEGRALNRRTELLIQIK